MSWGQNLHHFSLQEAQEERASLWPDSEGKALQSFSPLSGSCVYLWTNHRGQGNKIKPAVPIDILGIETNQSSFCLLWFVLGFLFAAEKVASPGIQVPEVLVLSTEFHKNSSLFPAIHWFWLRLTQQRDQGREWPLPLRPPTQGSWRKWEHGFLPSQFLTAYSNE